MRTERRTRAGVLALALAVVATRGAGGDAAAASSVTSSFQRPDAHPAVPLTPRGRETAETARGAPTQVHLAPTASGEMTVVWTTREALTEEDGTVEYSSTDEGRKKHYAKATSDSYTTQLCVGNPTAFVPRMGQTPAVDGDALTRLANTSAWADSDAANYRVVTSIEDVIPSGFWSQRPTDKAVCLGYSNPDAVYHSPIIHMAKMKGLAPGKEYAYVLPGTTDARTFKAPMVPTKHSKVPTKIAVVGDTGQTEVTQEVLTHVHDALGDSEVLLHTGDLSYADGFAPRWDSFGVLGEFLLKSMPMLVVPGNHDVAQNGMDLVSYMMRYPSPYEAAKSPSQLFWSYEVGQAHIIGLNSYANAQTGMFDGADTPMTSWLRKDLESVNRHYTPWVIVVFHTPWYNSNHGHFKEAERARKALEQTLYDAGVDLILNGHVHSYERSHPVLNYGLNDCAPVHIVVGDGGNYEGPYGESWMVPQPAYSAFREGSFGAGSLVIHNDTHASWEWRRTTCVANTTTAETYFRKAGDASTCRSIPDVSAQAMEPVDAVVLRRDVRACPNKAMGSAKRTSNGGTPYVPESNAPSLYTAIIVLVILWLATSVVLIRTLKVMREMKTRMYRSPGLLSGEDEFDDELGESAISLKDFSAP